MKYIKGKRGNCKTCTVAAAEDENLPCGLTSFWKFNNVVYWIKYFICITSYVGHTCFEIKHFKTHSLDSIKLFILAHEKNLDKRLERKNSFIINFKTLYSFGLNTCLNNIQINLADNIYLFLYQANKSKIIERYSRGSHKNSKSINNINPELWLAVLENDFVNTLKIFLVKNKKKNYLCLNVMK